MNKLNYTLLLLFFSTYCVAQQSNIPVPKPLQMKWHEAEMGAVFHYDLHVFDVPTFVGEVLNRGQWDILVGLPSRLPAHITKG